MQRLGRIVEWDDQRGFGFIVALEQAHPRYFLHIRDYQQQGRRPEPGELVKFSAQSQADGKWRAVQVRRAASPSATHRPRSKHGNGNQRGHDRSLAGWMVLITALGGLAWAIHRQRLPLEAGMWAVTVSVITYIAYALDKHAAQSGRWRIAENNLHLLELLGGWPGAWIAQRLLRHKTLKPSYRRAFWSMVVLNLAMVAGWLLTQH
ncbi:DUF1294 domain-containing protein [Pseudoxanthomonas dokdonensis]|uniref:DUF1294 domain-containing protein n=1 Tax=Pseudoxanthomonas dokdonensis TaxID=344882 RepID=UPI00070B5969|nr:DUF1294 domain-containing protein [Pseudoxanthomonas dokdonensis]